MYSDRLESAILLFSSLNDYQKDRVIFDIASRWGGIVMQSGDPGLTRQVVDYLGSLDTPGTSWHKTVVARLEGELISLGAIMSDPPGSPNRRSRRFLRAAYQSAALRAMLSSPDNPMAVFDNAGVAAATRTLVEDFIKPGPESRNEYSISYNAPDLQMTTEQEFERWSSSFHGEVCRICNFILVEVLGHEPRFVDAWDFFASDGLGGRRLDEVVMNIRRWISTVAGFDGTTPRSAIAHLKTEVEELENSLVSGGRDDEISRELADVLILVCDIATKMNIDLEYALVLKMRVNMLRKYTVKHANGMVTHDKSQDNG